MASTSRTVVTRDAVDAVRALARLLRTMEKASDELSLAHYRVLSAIGSGNERASRVAANLSLGKPTVSASVDALCRRGLITRSAVDSDQRAAALALTAEGQRVLERVERALVERLSEVWELAGDGPVIIEALASMGTALDLAAQRRGNQRQQR